MHTQLNRRAAAGLTATLMVAGLGAVAPAAAQVAQAAPVVQAAPVAQVTVSASAAKVSATNNKIAYDYFIKKGLTPQQAAGIIGNLMQESGTPINPTARQRGGPGMGIAQWSRGERWSQLVRYAAKSKRNPNSLVVQLDFIWLELNTTEKRAMKSLRSSRTVPAATLNFSRHFERCAPRWCHNDRRTSNAHQVLRSYNR